jgi:hypothetical protein
MTLPKMLATVTIDSTNQTFGFDQGGAQTVDITAGEYDSILEVLAELETQLQTVDATFAVTVSSAGFVTITCQTAWTENWATTDDALETLLGLDSSSDGVADLNGIYMLAASLRHQAAFYPPVGAAWSCDRRRRQAREQDTADGGMIQYVSSSEHRWRQVSMDLMTYESVEAGGSAADGAGGTIDWTDITIYNFWTYCADGGREFRFYPDRANGTVASPGTEGTEYDTCRFQYRRDWEPAQRDMANFALIDVVFDLKIVGS